ncbi:MAG: right-handed parallel beta-helix repeat-containing protein [Deltaproteobacteria bacterium]|nr:right-handed parallel beta-helix repeat-containing protein [Deltaproteobacteria bacterium]
MELRRPHPLVLIVCFAAAGCAGKIAGETPRDAGVPASDARVGATDAGSADAASPDGASTDAGADDAGSTDGTLLDDRGVADGAGPGDAAAGDATPAGDGGAADTGVASACAIPRPIDEGVTYARTLHVATSGTPGGDGSSANPFDTLDRAASAATPGTRIRVGAGRYPAVSLGRLSGEEGRPIALVADGQVVIDASSGVGISMSDGQWVVIEGFTIEGATVHGMNLDDDGTLDTPSHHLVLRGLTIAGAGSGGNNDCIKLSGIDDFWVLDSDVSGCNQGEIIDMVGCHRGVIHNNRFHDTVGSGVQTKGGSSDTLIHGNTFENIPGRAVNAGGSTGLAYLRPPDATYEAARIRVIANVFVGSGANGGAAIAYVGCDGCVAAHNTVIAPRTWVLRILQENTAAGFVPSRNGVFANNVIVLNAADIRTIVNVGAGTAPETFSFRNNLWYALDQGAGWVPPISGGVPPETGSIVQVDPNMPGRAGGDYRLAAPSPAAGAGSALGFPLPSDREGRCYADPATLGAFEMP